MSSKPLFTQLVAHAQGCCWPRGCMPSVSASVAGIEGATDTDLSGQRWVKGTALDLELSFLGQALGLVFANAAYKFT